MLYVRSALFLLWFAVASAILNVGLVPVFLMPRSVAFATGALWSRSVLLGLKWIAGLDCEVRGGFEGRRVIIAAKHFTMWETIAFLSLLHSPVIVMKRSLLNIPLYGWYARKMRMIGVDRAAGAIAIRALRNDALRAIAAERPIVIFPEGTRKKLGDAPDYKPGVAALYAALGVPCVPVAHNSGLYWDGYFRRRPGKIVLEYLEPIPPGLSRKEFLGLLEERTETATNRLLAEARAALS